MPATFETVLLAREFEKIGVDGIAVITPFFIACTQDGLIRHFSTVADAVSTPVYLYDIPARTQNHIEPETARTLAAHGNIAGIKDSGGAQDTLEAYLDGRQRGRRLRRLLRPRPPGALVAARTAPRAASPASATSCREVLAGIVSAFNAGDLAEAERQQSGLRRLPQGPLRPRLPAGAGEARALRDGPVGRRQPAAGAAAGPGPGRADRRSSCRSTACLTEAPA